VDRQAVLVQAHGRAIGIEAHNDAVDLVAEPAEAVRPRVQQGDAEGRAGLGVLRKAAALAEQLLSAVAQRAADHSHAGGEGRLQPGRRAQDAHRVAREGALADLVRGHSGDPYLDPPESSAGQTSVVLRRGAEPVKL